MPPRPHPRSATFFKWFLQRGHLAQALDAVFYRVAGPHHTTAKEIVSGKGAFIAGGRWNPIAEMRVVYLSQDPETATAEALEHFRYHRIPIAQALPKVIVAVAVRIDRLLDLTDPDVVNDLPIGLTALLAEDWRAVASSNAESASQALGWAAFAVGIQGLKVRSKANPIGTNVLVFPDNLSSMCHLRVLNEDDLEKLGKVS